MSLSSCLKNAGKLLPPELKTSILARAKQLREQGLGNAQASAQAAQEALQAARDELDAALMTAQQRAREASSASSENQQSIAEAAQQEVGSEALDARIATMTELLSCLK